MIYFIGTSYLSASKYIEESEQETTHNILTE